MFIWDSFVKISYDSCKPQQSEVGNVAQSSKEAKTSSKIDKKAMDWFLQTTLTPKIHRPNTLALKNPVNAYLNFFDKNQIKNPLHQTLSDFSPSEKEILQEITNYSHRYRQNLIHAVKELNIQSCDYNGNLDRVEFVKKIESRLKSKATHTITFQEVIKSQKFLEAQMDQIMLKVYQENPKKIQEIINKNYYFYKNDKVKRDNEAPKEESKENEKISTLLLEYGIRLESSLLEDKLKCFLTSIPMVLKNSLEKKEVDTQTLRVIEENINLYRGRKIEATGYKLFALAAERFSEEEQEQIADSIAKVLSFYSQSNSLETNGYKISWQPPPLSTSENPLAYGMQTALSNIARADIKIAFQMLLVFPTKL